MSTQGPPPSTETRIDPDGWEPWIADTDGPQIIVGGPGSGKTEFLVRRATHLIDTGVDPASIALLGFSRRGAAQMQKRIEARLDQSSAAIDAGTFHSLAFRIYETFGAVDEGTEAPALLTAPEQVAFVADLLAEEDPSVWSVAHRPILGTSRFAQEVTDFLLRCAEQRVGPEDLAAYDRDDWRGLAPFFSTYRTKLNETNRLDYGSLLAVTVDLMEREDVSLRLSEQYQYVLVDEYQDTSFVQAQLLVALSRHHHNLTAAADPYQSVFSFRGTDLANVSRFPADFRTNSGEPGKRLILTTSFRVPAPILDAAAGLTKNLELPGAAGPVEPTDTTGRVDVHTFDQATEEAEWIAREIERTHLVEDIPYQDMAVFVRTKKRFMKELSRALERRRIPHNRPDSRLVDHPTVRIVSDLVTAATSTGADRDRALRRLVLGPLMQLPPGEYLRLARRRSEADWDDLLREYGAAGAALAELVLEPSWATEISAAEGVWHIWDSLPQLVAVANDPDSTEDRYGWSSISQVLSRQFERDPAISLLQYLGWTEKDDFEADPLLRFRSSSADEVTLTSLHQAKGLEFDTIFIADAVEGVFPDLRTRESLLGNRHLSPNLPDDVVAYRRFRLQEETRLAYTAMTRSSRRVIWTATSANDDFQPGGPSRFLDRLGVEPNRPAEQVDPVSVIEAEAWLRRLAADPTAGLLTRSAAIENLAVGESWGGRAPTEIAGILPRGSDRGITKSGHLYLSPSQADSYARCPRRYALERKLGFTSGTTVYLSLGTLVHDVIYQTDERIPEPTSTDALETLDELFDAAEFGSSPWAEGWYERARTMLTTLYENRDRTAVRIAGERDVVLDVDGVTWRGKIDLVEARGSEVWIVDFKTSRTPIPVAEAAESVQLGFYVLAAQADPTIAHHGPIAGAELWYPDRVLKNGFATRAFDMGNLDLVRTTMSDLASDVEAERWDPVPGDACRTCSVSSSCPGVPEGQEAYLA